MSFNDQVVINESYEIEKYNKLIFRLTAYMVIMAVVFYILNYFFKFNAPWFIFAGLAASGSISYLLFKLRKELAAKIFGLTSFNTLIYLVAASESPLTNVNLYFGIAGIAALVLFGHPQRILAYSSIAISLLLYFLAKLWDFTLLDERTFTSDQIEVLSIINLVVFVGVSAYLVILLLDSNNRQKKVLLVQNLELKKINLELDRFIYSSSHDLRAPLSSLLGLIRISELEKDDSLRIGYLKMMRKRIETMDQFIRDLIDYSKNIRQIVELSNINIKELAESVQQDLKYMDGANSLRIDFDLLVPTIISDMKRMKIVFSNMISNAIKYQNRSNENLQLIISSVTDHNNVIIKFCDNGIGIPEEHLTKVFSMFHRAHDISIGSGLGLYIVQETLSTLRGTIKLDSKVGKGSIFTITIPA